MKIPPIYDRDEQDLEQFVIAAGCEEFAPACDLLFINANDLRWGGTGALIDLRIHPEAGEHYQEARQLIKTRCENGMMRLVRACLPLLDKAQEVMADETAAK